MPPISRRMILGSGLLVGLPFALHAGTDAGRVERAEGRAWADPDRTLAADAPVYIGDHVATGQESRLAMLLAGTTRILMGPETDLVIDRFTAEAGGELVLGSGAMLFDRPEDAPRTPVEVQSVFGVIAVRGTRFFAGPSKDVFGIFVERGTVRVTGGGVTVDVGAGLGTNIAAPGAPPTEPAPWGQTRIDAALALVGG